MNVGSLWVVRYQLPRYRDGHEVTMGKMETMLFNTEDKALKWERSIEAMPGSRIIQRTHEVSMSIPDYDANTPTGER